MLANSIFEVYTCFGMHVFVKIIPCVELKFSENAYSKIAKLLPSFRAWHRDFFDDARTV